MKQRAYKLSIQAGLVNAVHHCTQSGLRQIWTGSEEKLFRIQPGGLIVVGLIGTTLVSSKKGQTTPST